MTATKPTETQIEEYLTRLAELAREVDASEAVSARTCAESLERAVDLHGRAVRLFVEASQRDMPLSLRAWARGMAMTMKDTCEVVEEVIDEPEPPEPSKPN